MGKEVIDMARGHHLLAVYWVEGIKGCHTSHYDLLELYCMSIRNKARNNLIGFRNSPVPDVPNYTFDPITSEY